MDEAEVRVERCGVWKFWKALPLWGTATSKCLCASAPKHVSVFTPFFFFSTPFVCTSFSLGLCHLLSLPILPFFSSSFPSFLPSLLPSFLPPLSAHSSATIEAIEAIETVKDAEGKTSLISLCVRERERVQHGCALSRPCSRGHISSLPTMHLALLTTSLKPPH